MLAGWNVLTYIICFAVAFFLGGLAVWYIFVKRSRKKRAKNIYEDIQGSLEDVDKDFDITITMSFGVPGFASTKVRLEEKKS